MRRIGEGALELVVGGMLALAALSWMASKPGFVTLPSIGAADLENLLWTRHHLRSPHDVLVLADIVLACWAAGCVVVSAVRRIARRRLATSSGLPWGIGVVLVILLALQVALFLGSPLSRDGRISIVGPIPGDDSAVVGGKVYLKGDYGAIPLAFCSFAVTVCFLSDFVMRLLSRAARESRTARTHAEEGNQQLDQASGPGSSDGNPERSAEHSEPAGKRDRT